MKRGETTLAEWRVVAEEEGAGAWSCMRARGRGCAHGRGRGLWCEEARWVRDGRGHRGFRATLGGTMRKTCRYDGRGALMSGRTPASVALQEFGATLPRTRPQCHAPVPDRREPTPLTRQLGNSSGRKATSAQSTTFSSDQSKSGPDDKLSLLAIHTNTGCHGQGFWPSKSRLSPFALQMSTTRSSGSWFPTVRAGTAGQMRTVQHCGPPSTRPLESTSHVLTSENLSSSRDLSTNRDTIAVTSNQ